MFKIKVYMYDSSKPDYKGEDLSKYVLQGGEFLEDITREMDTTEIALVGLTRRKEFDPQTKLIIDIIDAKNSGEENIVATYHRCVTSDLVEQPILSNNEYFNHRISLMEPSVIAQKRIVDNIAVTYKLKDVNLSIKKPQPLNRTNLIITSTPKATDKDFGYSYKRLSAFDQRQYYTYGKYFQSEGALKIINPQGEEFDYVYNDIEKFKIGDIYKAKFRIPKLAIYWGEENTKNYIKLGYASIDYRIEEFSLSDNYNPINIYSGTFISNSKLGETPEGIRNIPIKGRIENEWLLEDSKIKSETKFDLFYKKYTDINAQDVDYITQEIEIKEDRIYEVYIYLHQFDEQVKTPIGEFNRFNYSGASINKFTSLGFKYATYPQDPRTKIFENFVLFENETSGANSFEIYINGVKQVIYKSSLPYSALALLQKAIVNSSIYEKQGNVFIGNVNNSKLPFYIDAKYADKLSSTLIIENFYNQKNLWEIMIEVGNYIHAIPELKFGDDDRFMITFNELGRTDAKLDTNTKMSIFNSRNIEDYISATSSYITNMVQLGGEINEWVAPKTNDETYTISNDTAQLILSKNIIELLEVKVKSNVKTDFAEIGEVADMTKYIYEKNVYKILPIEYNKNPNRGIAMYYELGSNLIQGGNYKLPQENDNMYSDLAFKKIIYCAFTKSYPVETPVLIKYWDKIKVNDYSFFIRYRTKDSVRQNHIRPDLRKYLLSTKYDRYPEHNQFNNQTDVVVDSIKFGSNMYGKLIKTGNSTYTVAEYVTSFDKLKQKGELYNINNELFYVAQVKNTIFSSHIISEVKYSKDYNELSAIIGIPSEPRFYEISEQSLIRREFAINDLLYLTTNKDTQSDLKFGENYVANFDHLADLMFGNGTDFAKFAISVFKGDKDIDAYNQNMGEPNFYKEVLTPINAYSSFNTLTYEWDMMDNYSAGDQVVSTTKEFYNSLLGVGYTDIFGKAPLFDFYILGNSPILTQKTIQALPESPISTKSEDTTRPFVFADNMEVLASNVKELQTDYNSKGLGLLKDCREAISVNYNLQLATNSDQFVISPFVFLPKKSNVKLVLLGEEVNKLSDGYINIAKIITPKDKLGNEMAKYFDVIINKNTQTSLTNPNKQIVTDFYVDINQILKDVADNEFAGGKIKAIALICDVSLNSGDNTQNPTLNNKSQFIVARNIPFASDRTEITQNWNVGAPNKNQIFKNIQ